MTAPTAIMIADSVSPMGVRVNTFQITAHRFILAEINTHCMFARNYRSSRAVPTARLLEEVRRDPAMPVYWGSNQPGMQAGEELIGYDLAEVRERWRMAAVAATHYAEQMAAAGLHKQIANRVLEPFMWVHGVISMTDWDNFETLRCHKDAQPEFRVLAEAMRDARHASTPTLLKPGQWHLPYVHVASDGAEQLFRSDDKLFGWQDAVKVSVARCARVSYKPFDADRPSTLEEDLALHNKLLGAQPLHASPAEHQCTPDDLSRHIGEGYANPHLHGKFRGWIQYRKTLQGEHVPTPEYVL